MQKVNEIFIVRAIACMSIVFLHAITSSLKVFPETSGIIRNVLVSLQMLLVYGTPVFVFISEFLLSKNNKATDKKFFIKRIKYLLLPFIFMAVIYAFIEAQSLTINAIIIEILRNILLADYTGYFVLIIFQFYILHGLFNLYFRKFTPKKVLIFSFLINIAYLAFFNFVPPIEPVSFLWGSVNWLPFTGWLFYFTLGYYAGMYYDQFFNIVQKHFKFFALLSLCAWVTTALFQHYEIIPSISSKRIDVVVMTSLLIPVLFYIASRFKDVPDFIYTISNYSFCIYLLHKIVLEVLENYFVIGNAYFYIVYSFIVAITMSIIVAYIINKIPFGKYIVGNIAKFKNEKIKALKTTNKPVIQ